MQENYYIICLKISSLIIQIVPLDPQDHDGHVMEEPI